MTNDTKLADVQDEYSKWILYEVILPLFFTVVAFFLLWFIYFQSKHLAQSASNALISVAGTGDLLIFGGLLVINVASPLFIEKGKNKGEGITRFSLTIFLGIFLLAGYVTVRVMTATIFASDLTTQFIFGIASLAFLLGAISWANHMVGRMHIRQLSYDMEQKMIRNQYNAN